MGRWIDLRILGNKTYRIEKALDFNPELFLFAILRVSGVYIHSYM